MSIGFGRQRGRASEPEGLRPGQPLQYKTLRTTSLMPVDRSAQRCAYRRADRNMSAGTAAGAATFTPGTAGRLGLR